MERLQYRDIQLIPNGSATYLAVACDVSAFIGSKPMDLVQVSMTTAGYFAAAVPLMEMLAIGAEIISVADTIGVEMAPSGLEIIEGVRQAMKEAGVCENWVTGSTEDNIPTTATSIGITVVGNLEASKLNQIKPTSGQSVYVVGIPKMGQRFVDEELVDKKGEVCTLAITQEIRQMEGVSHMLPIGSKGIATELETLLTLENLTISSATDCPIDLTASAGPSTCLLVTCSPAGVDQLMSRLSVPTTYIGTLR